MYVVLLRFAGNKSHAADHMSGHMEWIKKGVEDGVFLLVGGMRPEQGGAILAAGPSPDALQARIDEDPFVIHDVVTPEIIDIAPNHTDPRLAFLAE